MSFIKDNLPMLAMGVTMAIFGGLYSSYAFRKGHELGRKQGFELGEACGRLEQSVDDLLIRHAKTDNAINEKEEASE